MAGFAACAPVRAERWLGALALTFATLAAPVELRAQEIQLTGPLAGAEAASTRSRRSKLSSEVVPPTGHLEVAGEVAFLTSGSSSVRPSIGFTDVALLRLGVRRSFADWFELFGGGELLVKQPTSSHEQFVQNGYLGAQAEFSPGFVASLAASLGPLYGVDGLFVQGGPGLGWKPTVGRFLRFSLGLGNALTLLSYDDDTAQSFWLSEVTSNAEVQIGSDEASMWVGLEYAVPYAANPDREAPDPVRGFLDPQVRLNVELGGALNVGAEDWNVFAVYTVIDRGELEKPETTLPILDGGFDQHQLVVGVEYRFMPEDTEEDD